MSRDRHRRRAWRDRDGGSCPCCGRSLENVDRVDVHHRDGNPQNGHPDNLRIRCKRCHLQGEHDRDVDGPRDGLEPQRPRSTGPPAPHSLGP